MVTETASSPTLSTVSKFEAMYPPIRGVLLSPNRVTVLVTLPIIFLIFVSIGILFSISHVELSRPAGAQETKIEDTSEVVLELKEDVKKSSDKAEAFVEDIEELQRHLAAKQTKKDLKSLYIYVKGTFLKEGDSEEEPPQ